MSFLIFYRYNESACFFSFKIITRYTKNIHARGVWKTKVESELTNKETAPAIAEAEITVILFIKCQNDDIKKPANGIITKIPSSKIISKMSICALVFFK